MVLQVRYLTLLPIALLPYIGIFRVNNKPDCLPKVYLSTSTKTLNQQVAASKIFWTSDWPYSPWKKRSCSWTSDWPCFRTSNWPSTGTWPCSWTDEIPPPLKSWDCTIIPRCYGYIVTVRESTRFPIDDLREERKAGMYSTVSISPYLLKAAQNLTRSQEINVRWRKTGGAITSHCGLEKERENKGENKQGDKGKRMGRYGNNEAL